MLFKILAYIGGYVTIIVPEVCLEKFINMAATRGIYFWGIRNAGKNGVEMKVRLSSVHALRHVARMTRCRFQIMERAGLPFVFSKLRKRKALLGGALFFVILLYMLSSFVWFMEVNGNSSIKEEDIFNVARKAGLYRGVLKWSLNTAQVEKTVLEQVPGLSWVGVYVEGTRVRIKVVEKVLPPDKDQKQPIDLVAVKSGLVKQILVLKGNPLVKEGDTVEPGQVLISAAIPPPETEEKNDAADETDEESIDNKEQTEPLKYVRARGIVRARVWYEDYEEMRLLHKGVNPTGQEITKLCINFKSKEIILMGPQEVPYDSYSTHKLSKTIPSWRNINIPVEFISVKYKEEVPFTKRYNKSEARRIAGERALANIRSAMPEDAKIISKKVQEIETNEPEDIVRVKVLVETLEDISKEKPHQMDRGGSGIVDRTRGSQNEN